MTLYGAVFWLILIIAFCIVEGLTFSLVCIWFAGGAVFALIASELGAGVNIQYTVFLVSSGLLLWLTRPLVKRYFNKAKVKTNADRIIGQPGLVVKGINPALNEGQIKVLGQIWSAVPEDGVSRVEEGRTVLVLSITGVKACVREVADVTAGAGADRNAGIGQSV